MAIANLIVQVRTAGAAALGRLGAQLSRLGRQVGSSSRSWSRAGARAASSFASALVNGLNNLPTMVSPGVVAAAAAIGSLFAAALGAAVLLAAGGGVLAAGIAVAVRDPAVAGAFKGLAERAKTALKGFSEPFKAPLIKAASTFGDSLERIAPALKRMGAMMAPLIEKLAPALGQMAEKMMPGLEKAVQASIPLFEKLAEHLPKLGESVSSFFEKVAEAGPQIVTVFDFIMTAVEKLIEVLGTLINWGATYYSAMIGFWTGVKDVAVNAFATITGWALTWAETLINAAAKAFGWVPGIGPKLEEAAKDFNDFAAKVRRALAGIPDEEVFIRVRMLGGQMLKGAEQSGTYSSGIGGRAAGGPVRKGVPYIVGEKRPELFVPGESGYIQPHVPAAARMGGSGWAGGGGGGAMSLHLSVSPGRGYAGDPEIEGFLNKLRAGRIRLTVDRSNRVVPA